MSPPITATDLSKVKDAVLRIKQAKEWNDRVIRMGMEDPELTAAILDWENKMTNLLKEIQDLKL